MASLAPDLSETFRHDALLYAGPTEFVARMTAFIHDGLERDEHVLVMVTADKVAMLRSALGADARTVGFRDMAEVGRNPARIIPAWREFFAASGGDGRGVRGIGEPIWAARPHDELVESQRHEALINLAFTGSAGRILCPYDTSSLDPWIIREAERSHPFIGDGTTWRTSPSYRGLDAIARPFDEPLPEPAAAPFELDFETGPLVTVRRFVEYHALAFGLNHDRTSELLIAVSEVAANSLRHAGGGGRVRIWLEGDEVVCEIRDAGSIDDPLIGRRRPAHVDEGGLGLWLVNQLSDLVQLRSHRGGTVVRMHKSRRR